jgi:mRNA interferase HicA
MKRKRLLQHRTDQGCKLVREGGRHSWWENTAANRRSAIPRHSEINEILVKKICKDLGAEPPN